MIFHNMMISEIHLTARFYFNLWCGAAVSTWYSLHPVGEFDVQYEHLHIFFSHGKHLLALWINLLAQICMNL